MLTSLVSHFGWLVFLTTTSAQKYIKTLYTITANHCKTNRNYFIYLLVLMVYSTMLSVTETTQNKMVSEAVNNELER
jgi:hypothetical protein